MRSATYLCSAVAIVVLCQAPDAAGQEKVISGDQPLPARDRPDQDLTAEDFRKNAKEERGWPFELTLGLLFLVGVVILAGLKRKRMD